MEKREVWRVPEILRETVRETIIILFMKFLLTSAGVRNASIEKALLALIGKPTNEISVAFVPTAASCIAGDKGWLVDNLNDFLDRGFKSVDIVDIAAVPNENWFKRFETAELLCFGGGDEQYLAKTMRESGVMSVLPELLKTRVYGYQCREHGCREAAFSGLDEGPYS